eukprot:g3769.t1
MLLMPHRRVLVSSEGAAEQLRFRCCRAFDESGAFGQTEFLRAYMELCMQAGTAESAEGFKTAYDLQRADAGFLFKLLAGSAKKKKNQKQREEEVGVSLYNLVMRVVGVHDQDASVALGTIEARARSWWGGETDRKFQRFFKGLDINCSGLLSVAEVKQAFAEVAPSVPFTVVRRRILLAYGSLNGLMNEVKRSNEDSDSEVEMGSGATGFAQAEKLSEFLELPSWRISAFLEAIAVKAISIFLGKPLDRSLDELVADVQKSDWNRGLTFEERWVDRKAEAPDSPLSPLSPKSPSPKKGKDSKRVSLKPFTAKSLFALEGGVLPVKCTPEQLRVEQKHSTVSVNALLNSMTNISDILAIDQRSYQGGQRIVCRVRLGAETGPLCGKAPVLCVVPSRMLWTEEGKGHWILDGQKIKTFAQLGCLPHPLPSTRECTVWLTAPWSMTEHRAFDVRVFATDGSGRVPLRQVGGHVSFSVQLPSPPPPALEHITLEPGNNSCSALLHWVPPREEKYCPPVMKHILHIEPVIGVRQHVVNHGDGSVKELDVWNQDLRDLEKRRSLPLHGLQRGSVGGVPYRFSVQCAHQVESGAEAKEILGSKSLASEVHVMPVHPAPPEPGMPDGGGDAEQTELQLQALDVLSAGPAVLGEAADPTPNQSGALSPLARGRSLEGARPQQPRPPRTHCRLRWHLEEGQDCHYQVEAREERLPFYASWSLMPAFYRFKKEEKVGEVIVAGLEAFPPAEPLMLRLVKGSGKRGRTHSDGSVVIEASWELPDASRSEWSVLPCPPPWQLEEEEGMLNICFAQLQLPQGQGHGTSCWLRMRYQGPDGQTGDASAETDAVQLMDAMRSAAAAQEALRRHTIKKNPKRPQQLTVLGGSKSLWEVSWEQKGRSAEGCLYEAQVCFGAPGSETQDEEPRRRAPRGAHGGRDTPGPRMVSAVVSFRQESLSEEAAWRLRVRIQGGDWSTPSPWQEPGSTDSELPLPGQPSVRTGEGTGGKVETFVQSLQYEVQVQARKRRGSSKWSDWVAVRAYSTVFDQAPDVPPPPLLPPPPKPGPDPEEVPVEVKQHIENLQKSLGSAFTPKLEQDILAAAKAPAVAPKLEITHTDLNRAKQARTQYEAANGKLKEVDTKWKQFNHGLQAAYNVEHEEYKQKRAAALEDLQNKKVKLQEIQERIKNSAMNHNLVEEEPTDIPATGGFQMMDPIEVDIGSEDEELAEHQPVPCFGRTKASPTRQAEQPSGGIPKKVKQESGAASTGVGAGHVKS